MAVDISQVARVHVEPGEPPESMAAWVIRERQGEATRANELIDSGKMLPVLWKTMPCDGVAQAHQSMYNNEHLGKFAILVGAEAEGLGRTAAGPGAIRAEVGT